MSITIHVPPAAVAAAGSAMFEVEIPGGHWDANEHRALRGEVLDTARAALDRAVPLLEIHADGGHS